MIGRAVVIEVGATVEAREIGDGCLIEVNSIVGKGAVLGKVHLYGHYQYIDTGTDSN